MIRHNEAGCYQPSRAPSCQRDSWLHFHSKGSAIDPQERQRVPSPDGGCSPSSSHREAVKQAACYFGAGRGWQSLSSLCCHWGRENTRDEILGELAGALSRTREGEGWVTLCRLQLDGRTVPSRSTSRTSTAASALPDGRSPPGSSTRCGGVCGVPFLKTWDARVP